MYEPKNFKLYDRVIFLNTSDDKLDGQRGEVVGLPCTTNHPAPWHYIVLLDKMYNGNKALNITEACLDYAYKYEED